MSAPVVGRRGVSWQLALGIALGIITLGLGLWGWMEEGLGFFDALYHTLAAFHVGEIYRNHAEHLNEQLMIARFTGIGAVLFAAIGAFLGFVTEGLARLQARVFNPDVVVVGSHAIAHAAVEHIEHESKRRVSHLGAGAFHRRGRTIALAWKDEARKDLMLETHVKGARHVLVVEEDESEALALASAINALDEAVNVSAIVRDSRLAEDAGLQRSDHNFRIITASSLSVRALHRDHPPFLAALNAGQTRIHAVIIGFGHMGEAVARDLCVNCIATGLKKPLLTVVDPEIAAREAALRLRVPELNEVCDFDARQGSFGSGRHPPPDLAADAPPVTCVYVCLPDDSIALSALGGIMSWLRKAGESGAPVFIRLRNKALLPPQKTGPVVFGDHPTLLKESDFIGEGIDRFAKAYHAAYLASLPPEKLWREQEPGKNEAARKWEDLSERFRISSRSVVDHLSAKLASAGIDPARWQGFEGVPDFSSQPVDFTTDSALFEALAELEHDRFNAERRWSGWTFHKERHDPGLKHDCLVPYEDLPEGTKKYDREFIHTTQGILNRKVT